MTSLQDLYRITSFQSLLTDPLFYRIVKAALLLSSVMELGMNCDMLEVLWLFCLSILGQSLTVQPQMACATEMWRILDGAIKELSKVNTSWQ